MHSAIKGFGNVQYVQE